MINVTTCDKCVHFKVCGLKNCYGQYIEAIHNVAIVTPPSDIWHVKDCEDVIVDVKCKHFQKSSSISKQLTD